MMAAKPKAKKKGIAEHGNNAANGRHIKIWLDRDEDPSPDIIKLNKDGTDIVDYPGGVDGYKLGNAPSHGKNEVKVVFSHASPG
jgi:hypothetical protein